MANENRQNKPDSRTLIDEANAYIDRGFSKMGREIEDPTILERYVLAATYKSIRLVAALVLLCESDKTEEAFPILRSLMENVVNMRWIINKDTKERLKKYMSVLSNRGFGKQWTGERLDTRMKELDFHPDYYDFCTKITYDYSHINATALKWDEVYNDKELSARKWSPQALYGVTAQMQAHLLKALDTVFPGYFTGYTEISSQIEVERYMRKRFEEVFDLHEKKLSSSIPKQN